MRLLVSDTAKWTGTGTLAVATLSFHCDNARMIQGKREIGARAG